MRERVIRLLPAHCPNCGTRLDAAAAADGSASTPKHGDLSICFRCGEILEFNEQLRLRLVPAEDPRRFDPIIVAARVAARELDL